MPVPRSVARKSGCRADRHGIGVALGAALQPGELCLTCSYLDIFKVELCLTYSQAERVPVRIGLYSTWHAAMHNIYGSCAVHACLHWIALHAAVRACCACACVCVGARVSVRARMCVCACARACACVRVCACRICAHACMCVRARNGVCVCCCNYGGGEG